MNPYSCEEQIYQLDYSICVQFFLYLALQEPVKTLSSKDT